MASGKGAIFLFLDMNKFSFLSKAKLYKIRLVSNMPTLFGDRMYSNEWNLLEKTLDDDVHKNVPLSFEYPNNKKKVYYRRHLLCPANGSTLLAVGQFRDPMDFSYVFITLHSKYYKDPYIAIEKYLPFFRNPDNLADMVAMAFNWVLRNTGCEVRLEPWDTKGEKVFYLKDFWESYNIELYKSGGRNLIRAGYEDSLEAYKKQEEGKVGKKSDDIMDYIEHPNKETIIIFLHHAVKGRKVAKDIARPVRLLSDYKVFKDNNEFRLPYKAFIKTCPEVKELISERKYNHWLNKNSTNYDLDDTYKKLEKTLMNIL